MPSRDWQFVAVSLQNEEFVVRFSGVDGHGCGFGMVLQIRYRSYAWMHTSAFKVGDGLSTLSAGGFMAQLNLNVLEEGLKQLNL